MTVLDRTRWGRHHDFTMAVLTDGATWAVGRNDYGQLGLGTVIERATPAQVPAGPNVTVIAAGRILRPRHRHPTMTDTNTSGGPHPKRRRWRIWLTALITLGVGVGVCAYDGELAAMRRDPILQPLPRAVDKARVEVHRSDFMFPTSPRVEVAWGVPGTIEEVTARYLDEFGATHGLHRSAGQDYWKGAEDP